MRNTILFISLLSCIFSACLAQNNSSIANASVVRVTEASAFVNSLRSEFCISTKLRAHTEITHNTQQNYQLFNESYQIYIQGGLDVNPGGPWLLGSSFRFSRNFNNNLALLSKGYVAHTGKLGSMYLHKEFSGELFSYSRNGSNKPPAQARLGLGGSLGKHWKEWNTPIYVQTSFKVYLNQFFDSTFQFIYKQRFIDQTRFTVEAGIKPTRWLWVSPFIMVDTRYYYRLGLFDINGNSVVSEARVNERFPVLGIKITGVVFPGKQENYHPGLPLR
ncbi:MAG: hypothetical protein MUF42_06940 [Cytophagaceae bacterium]|jgi:hypothetical protein|nr:hypothetical protein [Cytophagaceae bacterium]